MRLLAVSLAVAIFYPVPALAGKNSGPSQVMMLATMPPAFSLQAAQASVNGASGNVHTQAEGRGRLLIRGQLRGHGGRVVVRIPVSLAANTRSFVVRSQGQSLASNATIYLAAPEMTARPAPMRGQTSLAMGFAKNYGHECFVLNQPLHSVLEIVFENLPAGQASNFSLVVSMRDLGY